MNFDEAMIAVRDYSSQLLSDQQANIVAVAVGCKNGGSIVGAKDFCVTAFVERKLTETELEARGGLAFNRAFAHAADLLEPPPMESVDVVETGTVFATQPGLSVPVTQRGQFGGNPPDLDAQKRFESIRIGIGVANPVNEYPSSLSVGTAGFYMTDDTGTRYLVSNNHVIGKSNSGTTGDVIVQPGTLDLTMAEISTMSTLNALTNRLGIAELTAVVQLDFVNQSNIPINHADVALARLTDSGRGVDDIDRLTYGGCLQGVAAPYQVDDSGAIQGSPRVYKVGRTTGYTEGVVTNLGGVVNIPYPGGTAHFTDQIIFQATADNGGPFSDQGDSGSGVLNDQHELVGLLFAGSLAHTIANPIGDVIQELKAASGIDSLEVVTS